LPCRSTFTAEIDKLYNVTCSQLIRELLLVDQFAITSDGWSSKYSNKSFSTITIHYIEPNSRSHLKSLTLDTLAYGQVSHTGQHIKEIIEKSLIKWNIRRNN
jgi:hypothetical protein